MCSCFANAARHFSLGWLGDWLYSAAKAAMAAPKHEIDNRLVQVKSAVARDASRGPG